MKISAKGRYALASLLFMVEKSSPDEFITIPTISKALSISKIYLEQTFALLKKADIVFSVKGAQGGYQLASPANEISCLEILVATETTLFDQTDSATGGADSLIDQILEEKLFTPLNEEIERNLSGISLADLSKQLEKQREEETFMFYI